MQDNWPTIRLSPTLELSITTIEAPHVLALRYVMKGLPDAGGRLVCNLLVNNVATDVQQTWLSYISGLILIPYHNHRVLGDAN